MNQGANRASHQPPENRAVAKRRAERKRKLALQDLGDRYLINKEALAHRYSVSPRTIDFWVQKKRIPSIKVGRELRFRIEDCDRAVERFGRAAARI